MGRHDWQSIDLQRVKRVDRVLEKVLEAEIGRRQQVLEEAAEGDEALRLEVAAMLEGLETPPSRLRPGGALSTDLLAELDRAIASSREGLRIGRYRLLSLLGLGGMGVVYLAERVDGELEKRVALKLLSIEASPEHLERFHRERQILARLEHPNIARWIDGGTTGEGSPYLVMELVEGRSVDRHCAERGLSLRERTRLLIEICEAVEAAHRRLVVHRDLKPANILVTEDGHRPKLLDFGIARILTNEDPSGMGPLPTASRVMTPQYASPEQVLGEHVGVASDIYQLGLLAWELLIGERPYELRGAPAHEALRRICELEPELPKNRLPADLGWVLQKALRKEPDQRYGSVAELRDDLERFLADRPISARAPSPTYLVGRFVRRHAWAVSLVAAALLILVTMASVFTWSLARERDQTRMALSTAEEKQALAEQREREAEAVTDFLSGLFHGADPFEPGSIADDPSALELLERGAKSLREDQDSEPLVRARACWTIGVILAKLSRFDEAMPLLEESVALLRQAPENRRTDLANALEALGSVGLSRQDPAARALVEEALHIRIETLGEDHPRVARTLLDLAFSTYELGLYTEAAFEADRAVALLAAAPEPDLYFMAQALVGAGASLHQSGDFEAGRSRFERALELAESELPACHPLHGVIHENLGLYHAHRGRHRQALETYETSRAIFEKSLGMEHYMSAQLMANTAGSHLELGELAEAEALLDKALAVQEAALGSEHTLAVECRLILAAVLLRRGRSEEAVEVADAALRSIPAAVPSNHFVRVLAPIRLGAALRSVGRLAEAKAHLDRGLEQVQSLGGRHRIYLGEVLLELGELRTELGEPARARTLYTRALEAERAFYGLGDRAPAWAERTAALRIGEELGHG